MGKSKEYSSKVDEATPLNARKPVGKQVLDVESVPLHYTTAVENYHQNTAIYRAHHTIAT